MSLSALLLVSPDSDGALDRAAASGADGLIVDVAAAHPAALRRAAAFLSGAWQGAVYLRVGGLATAETAAALDALLPARPTGVALAANGGSDVTRLSALLRPREAIAGMADGATEILALATETPAALLAIGTYAGAGRRLTALAWDDGPLSAALGAEDASEVARSARAATLIAAAAAGIAALDRPFRGSDAAALRAEAEAARRAGFAGKLAGRAEHIPIIARAFGRSAGTSS